MAEEPSSGGNFGQGTECPTQETQTECQWCVLTFSTRAEYDVHMDLLHRFSCKLCGMVFHLETLLQDHLSSVHRVPQQELAGASHTSASPARKGTLVSLRSSYLGQHVAAGTSALEDAAGPAVDCGPRSDLSFSLLHQGPVSIPPTGLTTCHLCGAQFARTYLSDHMKSVHQGHQYRCTRCSRTFSWRGSLWKHERKCTGAPQLSSSDPLNFA